MATNAWQHVRVVSDGTTVRAYVEGVQSGTPQNARLGNDSGPQQIGSWIFGPFNPYDFSGTMDEVRVYNRALSRGRDRHRPHGSPPDRVIVTNARLGWRGRVLEVRSSEPPTPAQPRLDGMRTPTGVDALALQIAAVEAGTMRAAGALAGLEL